MTAESGLIEVRGVRKVFKDFWGRPRTEALKGVNLTVHRGEVLGVLGPNGAGKSTLLKLLLGHLYPTSGEIRVLGASPQSVETKARMGYLPENPAFWSALSARELLMFFGRMQGLSVHEIALRSEQLLAMTGILHTADRAVGEFSHGMRKRLGLAQALLNDPDLLILDEPTAGMDPMGCREVKDLILTLAKRGKTVVMTSHLLADMQDVCSEAVILYGGKIQAQGELHALLANPDESVIRTQNLTPETEAAIRMLLPAPVEISHPERSLESYFLEVVERARGSSQTGGARSGSGVAAYLSGKTDEPDHAAIAALEKHTVPEFHPTVNQAVLENLLRHPLERGSINREALDALTRKD